MRFSKEKNADGKGLKHEKQGLFKVTSYTHKDALKDPKALLTDKCSEIDDVISYHFEVEHIISLGQFIVRRNFEIFNVLLLVDFNVLIKLGTFL